MGEVGWELERKGYGVEARDGGEGYLSNINNLLDWIGLDFHAATLKIFPFFQSLPLEQHSNQLPI